VQFHKEIAKNLIYSISNENGRGRRVLKSEYRKYLNQWKEGFGLIDTYKTRNYIIQVRKPQDEEELQEEHI
jgi:hypothetical protein